MISISTELKRSAEAFNFDPLLLAAIALQESSGNPTAFRYEPAFYSRYIKRYHARDLRGHWPERSSEAKEKTLRACSFGLMQVMGQVARELGFASDEMFDLFDVRQNLTIACKKLSADLNVIKKLQPEAPEETVTAKLLRRYNGGGNPAYPAEVIGRIKTGEAAKLLA